MKNREKFFNRLRRIIVFAMLGTMMFISDILMEALPNIHIVGAMVIVCTLVYRVQALIPVYVYVFLNGLYAGFDPWWYPYLYAWLVLWAFAMLIPLRLSRRVAIPTYMLVCAFHGLIFGVLCAPVQAALYFNFDFTKVLAWIVAGFPFDVLHAVGNFVAGVLVYPLSRILARLEGRYSHVELEVVE